MKLISGPSCETCWRDWTVVFCAPSKMFLISEASPLPCLLSEEQFGFGERRGGVSCGVVLGLEFGLHCTVTDRNSTSSLVFNLLPSWPNNAAFQMSPNRDARMRGAQCSRHKRRWSNRAWVSGSSLIEKFTLGSRNAHSRTTLEKSTRMGKAPEPSARCTLTSKVRSR